jgi:4'-phosphopantetheinyl transferase EntD
MFSGPVGAELDTLMEEMSRTSELMRAVVSTTALAASPPDDDRGVEPVLPQRTTLRVSTETMPYLRDHCFFRQRDGWPDESDRRPVMPGTTIIWHMTNIAGAVMPGRRVVELRELRLLRWLAAAPPVDVPVTVEPVPGRTPVSAAQLLKLDFGGFSTAVAETAPDYPAPRPEPWRWDTTAESVPQDTAEEMYRGRLMFHGPEFQAVTELTATGPRHIRGVITVPTAPGALLDCAGQILGYWIIRSFTTRTRVLPVQLGAIRYFGPHPPAGTRVGCHVRVTHVDDTTVEADIQLTENGRVWAEMSGWRNRRFDNHPETQAVESFPEYRALSRPQPGGWVLLFERWADLASRDLVMRNHLNAAERAEYEVCPPPRRRHWLLGRIAAKDAVRTHLWEGGEETVFPAEIRVGNAADGQPWAEGVHGRKLPPLDLSIAHCAQAAVAMIQPHDAEGGVGVDIEEVVERSPELVDAALDVSERELLEVLQAQTGEPCELWFTRFWAAKEAAAKAERTGLNGRPKRFRVDALTESDLLVTVLPELHSRGGGALREHRVGLRTITNPEDLEPRDYVVAWTM